MSDELTGTAKDETAPLPDKVSFDIANVHVALADDMLFGLVHLFTTISFFVCHERVSKWSKTYFSAVKFSCRETLKVNATELADDVVELLWLFESALADEPWEHRLGLVCHEIFPCLSVEVTLDKASVKFYFG